MILGWMMYSILFGGLCAASAHALESAARVIGRPTRWIWFAAMMASRREPGPESLDDVTVSVAALASITASPTKIKKETAFNSSKCLAWRIVSVFPIKTNEKMATEACFIAGKSALLFIYSELRITFCTGDFVPSL